MVNIIFSICLTRIYLKINFLFRNIFDFILIQNLHFFFAKTLNS